MDYVFSDEMRKKLVDAGIDSRALNAKNNTATKVIKALLPDNEGLLLREAEAWLTQIEAQATRIESKCEEIRGEVEMVKALREIEKITDERARNAVALYSQLVAIAKSAGADAEDAVTNAGYAVYAYLGGQAKRETAFVVGDAEGGKRGGWTECASTYKTR